MILKISLLTQKSFLRTNPNLIEYLMAILLYSSRVIEKGYENIVTLIPLSSYYGDQLDCKLYNQMLIHLQHPN